MSYQRNNDYDSKLICQTASKPSSIANEYSGGMGVTVIRDNVYTSSANLASAVPSANAVYSYLNDAQFVYNQTTDVTVWLKGFILPSKTSSYEFSITTNGTASLFISTDSTSANKVGENFQ